MGSPGEFASFINSSFQASGGATVVPCAANPANDCGADQGGSYAASPPAAGLCTAQATVGAMPSQVGSNWNWSCTDNSSGTSVSCSATFTAAGCGPAPQSWVVGGVTCQGNVGAQASGGSSPATSAAPNGVGSATFACSNGSWSLQAGATCTAAALPNSCAGGNGVVQIGTIATGSCLDPFTDLSCLPAPYAGIRSFCGAMGINPSSLAIGQCCIEGMPARMCMAGGLKFTMLTTCVSKAWFQDFVMPCGWRGGFNEPISADYMLTYSAPNTCSVTCDAPLAAPVVLGNTITFRITKTAGNLGDGCHASCTDGPPVVTQTAASFNPGNSGAYLCP